MEEKETRDSGEGVKERIIHHRDICLVTCGPAVSSWRVSNSNTTQSHGHFSIVRSKIWC